MDNRWTNVGGLTQSLILLPLGANGQRCHGVVDHSEDDLTSGDLSYGLGVINSLRYAQMIPNDRFSGYAQELMARVWMDDHHACLEHVQQISMSRI